MAKVADWLQSFGGWAEVEKCMEHISEKTAKGMPLFAVRESVAGYGAEYADVSF